jgi:hypothetical protein
MSGTMNNPGSISPQNQDEIAIVVGNSKIVGWETFAITRSVEHFPNSFVLTASDQFPDDPTRATIFPSGPGEKCQVYVGNDLVITGHVDSYGVNIGPGHHDVTITGSGLCQDLVDCSPDVINSPDLRGGHYPCGGYARSGDEVGPVVRNCRTVGGHRSRHRSTSASDYIFP